MLSIDYEYDIMQVYEVRTFGKWKTETVCQFPYIEQNL
jgi:hypothetical protein